MGKNDGEFGIHLTSEQRQAVEEFRRRYRTGVLALLFTDVVGSTELKQRLGDAAGIEMLTRRQTLVREVLASYDEADVISTAGDSSFIVFVKPSDAVRFALRLQSSLRSLSTEAEGRGLFRIGIHMGEVFIAENGSEGGGRDVLGIQVDTASRVMSLAAGGQILMTRSVFDNARTILKGEALADVAALSWLNHGRYSVKGVDEPIEVCEVGESGWGPLTPPGDSAKARRFAAPDSELVLGWRPAVDQLVPSTEWKLENRLGEGGFGEVWRARHQRTQELRVFKFCFRADHLRSLKRELTIFRILKQSLGERPDIARLYDVQFEQAPYYLELEYTPGGSLSEWIESRGGFEGRGPDPGGQGVPMALRLEIVAQIATALAAAHSVGVIHKDVKPSNILVEEKRDGAVQIRLTDFGIGQLQDRQLLSRIGFTITGFTEVAPDSPSRTSMSGTRLYMAPELLAGRPPSIQSDIYSLGTLLFQMVVGNLRTPLTSDWRQSIDDPLLGEDLHQCVAGDPGERFSGADELARRIRRLDERRRERARRQEAERAQVRRRRIAIVSAAVAAVLLPLAVVLGYGMAWALREKAKAERESYYAKIGVVDKAIGENRPDRARQILATCPVPYRHWEWGRLQYLTHLDMQAFEHPDIVTEVAWSPDGRLLATAVGRVWETTDNTARIWDTATGDQIAVLKGHTGPLNCVAFSPDGEYVATGSSDRTALLWEVSTGKSIRRFGGGIPLFGGAAHNTSVGCLAFSPDGRFLLTGEAAFEDASRARCLVRIWDVATGRLEGVLPGFDGGVSALRFGPEGRVLASGGHNGGVALWEFESRTQLVVFQAHSGRIGSLSFSPDGKRLATGSYDQSAKIWDLKTSGVRDAADRIQVRYRIESTYYVRSAIFSPDGKLIAATVNDDLIRLYDAETGEEVDTLTGHNHGTMSLAFSPDGRRLASGSWDKTARIWDVKASRPILVLGAHAGQVRNLDVSPDGRRIATATQDGTVRIWDAQTGRLLDTFECGGGMVRTVRFDPTAKRLVAGLVNGRIEIRNLETQSPVCDFQAHRTPVTSLRFTPDGKQLTSTSGEKLSPGRGEPLIKIWDAESGKLVRSIKANTYKVCTADISPDGKTIAAGFELDVVRVWELASGRELMSMSDDLGFVQSIAFSRDGKRLAVGGRKGNGIIYDARTGRKVATLSGEDIVHSVDFSPDGKRLVTGSWGRTARIWDAENGREILTLKGHNWAVTDARFSPDGRFVATAGSSDGTARLWFALPWEPQVYDRADGASFAERAEQVKRDYWRERQERFARLDVPSDIRRRVEADRYSPGKPLRVALEIGWNGEETAATVVDRFPDGWTIQGAMPAGVIEDNAVRWEFDRLTSAGATLEYTLVPPAEARYEPAWLGPGTFDTRAGVAWNLERQGLLRDGVLAFQQGVFPNRQYSGCSDAHVLVHRPNANAGGCPHFEEGDWFGGTDDHKKMLIRFDLSTAPTTFTVGRAFLRLYSFREVRSGQRNAHTLYAARLRKLWDEGSGAIRDGDPAGGGDVTYNHARLGEMPWQRAGILGELDVADWESSATAGADWPEWVTFDVTESVRAFLESPDANFGWKISQDPVRGTNDKNIQYVSGVYAFKSREAPEPHLRPILLLLPEQPGWMEERK